MESVTSKRNAKSNGLGTELYIKQEPQYEFFDNAESNGLGTELYIKQEPQVEFLDNVNIESASSIFTDHQGSVRIKEEIPSETEVIIKPSKKRRRLPSNNNLYTKKIHINGTSDTTQLPCIINIKSPVLEKATQNHDIEDPWTESDDELPNTSSICEKTRGLNILNRCNGFTEQTDTNSSCELNDSIRLNKTIERNGSNDTYTLKVYQMLVEIQSTLKDLKTQIEQNSQKIDRLNNVLDPPLTWKSTKCDFAFPISTDKELLDIEKQLENKEEANKLFEFLINRHYVSSKEMIRICLKYMLSKDVAVLYNLNGIKGSKKKFRDYNLCNILVESVKHNFKETTTQDILKRISLTLATSRDWYGRPRKE